MPRTRITLALVLAVAVASTTGCVMTVTPSVNSAAVQEVDFSKTFTKGEDCALMVLLFGPFGDASIVNAARKAGVSKVHVVDVRVENYIFANRRCIVVYGE